MYFVYVIKSIKNGKKYTGQTNCLERRLFQHNNKETKSNKLNAPFELIFVQECENRSESMMLERYLKSGSGREFINSIAA